MAGARGAHSVSPSPNRPSPTTIARTASRPSTTSALAITSHDTDQVAAHSASIAVRRRPEISRRAKSWPPTIAAVLAA